VRSLSERIGDKLDGEVDMDLHGNIEYRSAHKPKKGIDEAGVYILRDGKLVKGRAEIREQA
jgi:hypothetical protein